MIQFWELAGQHKYKTIAPIYYRGNIALIKEARVVVCVYDITSL